MKKSMKILSMLLAISLLLLSFAGCGKKKDTIDLGDGGKIEIGDDGITGKDKDGNEFSVGTEWPDSEWGKKIPKFTQGEISSCVDMKDGLVIAFVEVKNDDFAAYLEVLKEYFSKSEEMQLEAVFYYSGNNEDDVEAFIQYFMEEEAMTITVGNL